MKVLKYGVQWCLASDSTKRFHSTCVIDGERSVFEDIRTMLALKRGLEKSEIEITALMLVSVKEA